MKTKKILILICLTALITALAASALAQSSLPANLQKIIDFNNKSTADFALKISFFIAFLAGMLGILSPCILPFLPAYFSYTFKEKRNITKMTAVFFLGFSLVFVTMGAIAGFIGEQVLVTMQKSWLVAIAGIFMIILGIITLHGKNVCSYLNMHNRFKNDIPGVFLFGMFFAVGWTACLGPILAGILGIGAILGNIWQSALLLFFYSLGNLVPLFTLSMLYDRFNLSESKIMQGKILEFSIAGKRYCIHSTSLISGLLLIAFGITLLVYKGTAAINRSDVLGTKQYFYSLQRQLIDWRYANVLSIALFIIFIALIARFLWNQRKKKSD